jgi:type IV pilus assembly protein PilF
MSRRLVWIGLLLVLALVGCKSTPGHFDEATGTYVGPRRASAQTYAGLAVAYLRTGQLDIALSKAKEALQVDSDNAYANNVMGLVYQRLGEAKLAEKHFRRALDSDPSNPFYLNAYGSLLCNMKRYDEARQRFDQAATNPLNESPEVALTNAGICEARRPDPARAETYFRRALEINPRFQQALLGMAQLSFARGKFMEARAYNERFEQAGAPTPESLLLGVRTERALGDLGAASLYVMKLKSKFPDSPEVQALGDPKRP